jgi:hypothetical protein
MHKVKLYTRLKEYVTTVTVPVMTPPAEVIGWGSRLFVYGPDGVYREGVAWVVTGQDMPVDEDPV